MRGQVKRLSEGKVYQASKIASKRTLNQKNNWHIQGTEQLEGSELGMGGCIRDEF